MKCLFSFLLFLFGTLSFAQSGFIWEKVPHVSSRDSLNFTNNQYDCPLFSEYWKIFDRQELKGDKKDIITHSIAMKP